MHAAGFVMIYLFSIPTRLTEPHPHRPEGSALLYCSTRSRAVHGCVLRRVSITSLRVQLRGQGRPHTELQCSPDHL